MASSLQLPSIRELILAYGVKLERVCSCCFEQRLFEIDAAPNRKPTEAHERFYVCMRCDVPR